MAENVHGLGWMPAIACEDMMFGSEGQMNFPADQRRLAYVKTHGSWPTDEQLIEFEGRLHGRPALTLVR
ncbi:hypothetical protein [Hydrogenophaga sp. BPS33]|uniref:hypothetical protein n=1 Tax=Hydrogenophaga sp. BPS33 TaxID=2651974 RepID=UPI0013204D33|nr:hypothetical protein [Hydrogenophaga sp. BPS33]QHE89235.1 hypothetical protein F9K07_30075 [Hydrogenophaga sp. BPS33]